MVTHTSQQSSTPKLLCPCGKAGRAELERISRGALIKTFLFWLPLKRYKCLKCGRRSLQLRRSYA